MMSFKTCLSAFDVHRVFSRILPAHRYWNVLWYDDFRARGQPILAVNSVVQSPFNLRTQPLGAYVLMCSRTRGRVAAKFAGALVAFGEEPSPPAPAPAPESRLRSPVVGAMRTLLSEEETHVPRLVVNGGIECNRRLQRNRLLLVQAKIIDAGLDGIPVETTDISQGCLICTPADGDYREQAGRYSHSDWAREQRAEPA